MPAMPGPPLSIKCTVGMLVESRSFQADEEAKNGNFRTLSLSRFVLVETAEKDPLLF